MNKSLIELAGEMEAVCQQIRTEPDPGIRIMKCATVTYLAEAMQAKCSEHVNRMMVPQHWVPQNIHA